LVLNTPQLLQWSIVTPAEPPADEADADDAASFVGFAVNCFAGARDAFATAFVVFGAIFFCSADARQDYKTRQRGRTEK
jgi:hypothetical protein